MSHVTQESQKWKTRPKSSISEVQGQQKPWLSTYRKRIVYGTEEVKSGPQEVMRGREEGCVSGSRLDLGCQSPRGMGWGCRSRAVVAVYLYVVLYACAWLTLLLVLMLSGMLTRESAVACNMDIEEHGQVDRVHADCVRVRDQCFLLPESHLD